MASILAGLTRLVVFDTAVADLTETQILLGHERTLAPVGGG